MTHAELRALLSAATKGPWIDWGARVSTAYPSRDPMDDGEPLQIADCDVDVRIDYDTTGQANAALIVAAVNSLEALLDRVEAMQDRLDRIVEIADREKDPDVAIISIKMTAQYTDEEIAADYGMERAVLKEQTQ